MSTSYTLYLARSADHAFDEYLTQSARDRIARGNCERQTSDQIGEAAVLYIFGGNPARPQWLNIVQEAFENCPNVQNQSNAAVILFRHNEHVFALSMSYGWMYLNDRLFTTDFGLKCIVNLLDEENIRSIETSHLGIAMRDAAQAATQRDLQSFGITDALELVRKVSGQTQSDQFLGRATGAKQLKFNSDQPLTEIAELADIAYELYTSDAYRRTAFRIIDTLEPITDEGLINPLNNILINDIINNLGEFELSIPEIVRDEFSYVKIQGTRSRHRFSDVSIQLYRSLLGDLVTEIDFDDLLNHRVQIFDDAADRPRGNWSVFHSLVGSVEHEGHRYALNESQWYRIDRDFRQETEEHYDQFVQPLDPLLQPLIVHVNRENGRTTQSLEEENDYNHRVAGTSGYICMDRELVNLRRVGGDRFELCDLIDVQNRRFIHVKKGSRSSSILSHLFKQGSHAAQLLKMYEDDVRRICLEMLEENGRAAEADILRGALGVDDWNFEYRIVDYPRNTGNFDVPFFSKMSFRDESLKIRSLGFGVGLGFINQRPPTVG